MVFLGRSKCSFTSKTSLVKIITDILFEEELDKYLDDAYEQYGQKCVDHWQKGYEGIIKRLMLFPESYPPVNELKGVGILLRGAILMDNFKIIYHYDEDDETIYLHDIWDMRNNPRKLKMRFNQFKHI